MLGIMKVGGVFIPIDANAPVERSMTIIQDHQVRVLVCTTNYTDILDYINVDGMYRLFSLPPRY